MGNTLITSQEAARVWLAAFLSVLREQPTEMFIEGQYNWERQEFDDHG